MKLDPRTQLALLVFASVFVMFAREVWQLHVLVAISALYLLGHSLLRQTVYFVLAYIAFMAVLSVIPDYSAAFGIIVYTLARMTPVAMIGAALTRSSPSRIMCALERAAIPKPMLVMICILFRFFPVLAAEIKAIRDGIRARGIFPHWYSLLRQPAFVYECYFVPLIVRCLKLSSELASSAELRGIECGSGRTSIHPVGLKARDGLTACIYVLMGISVYWEGGPWGT
ncbi:energy-coupling factor transporter transmembrane protein EcfT [Xylanibacillus composti]|uniref:Energy-coupling factor transporter transmembrane protein EcfT n=1 Tax=Xylanibacillus composti TaxID=1572762 RepID=A0A8J4M3P2_9BACL|nr:energy-coupling factor transporter transmembrane component T [Xylanibacillus composti]MDT9724559.1 energy-coupling factor transporter transmembrane protein EcfT [Xylanibacillus composti]GIQ70282.1 energy-coupling factor transporter transmembrane protein EcfT [Xylanibacillus composti]